MTGPQIPIEPKQIPVMLALTASDTGNLLSAILLNVVLIWAAWQGELPTGFYLTSAAANLLMMLPMKRFSWWWGRPASLRSARLLLLAFSSIWILAALARIVVYASYLV